MSKDRRLGRGLAALLGGNGGGMAAVLDPPSVDVGSEPELAASADAARCEASPTEIPIDRIVPNPYQPRRQFARAELDQLAASLKQHALLQPIVVRKAGDRYELISGERRLRAASLAGWSRIPAQVREVDDQEMAELALVENLQRKDLSPMEKARAFRRYLQTHKTTQEALAKRLQLDRSTVANFLRLLELPDDVQRLVEEGKLGAGHARTLLALATPEAQSSLAQQAVKAGWSVREVERQVRAHLRGEDRLAKLQKDTDRVTARPKRSPQIASLEQNLRKALGTAVEIRLEAGRRGTIVISFANQDEFRRLYATLTEDRLPQAEAA